MTRKYSCRSDDSIYQKAYLMYSPDEGVRESPTAAFENATGRRHLTMHRDADRSDNTGEKGVLCDAIITTRPYKTAATAAQTYAELMEVARGWRREDLLEAFIALKMSMPSAGGRRL